MASDQLPQPRFHELLRRPIHALAFGFGSGLAPKAPGTFGTLAAVPLYVLWLSDLSLALYLGVVLVTLLAGVYICHRASAELGVHDHPGIVWDEFVGFWIAMIAAPPGWIWLLAGFVLFRVFDIWKPWPIRWCDRQLQGGVGIMLDDVLAGLMALLVMQGAAYVLV